MLSKEVAPMSRSILFLVAALAICLAHPAAAAKGTAPFGCEAVKPKLCYFRIFYLPRQTRQVILPAGVKENIPGVDIGRDQYCMKIGGAPAYKCERKTITSKENN
jgi:hypothetical protein